MRVFTVPAAMLGTNCYVVARDASPQSVDPQPTGAVIIDPGVDVMDGLSAVMKKHHLQPQVVLLTHGHLDHTASAAQVSNHWELPVWIHTDDLYLLKDPLLALSPDLQIMLGVRQVQWVPPQTVHTFKDGQLIRSAGLAISVAHAPGHTPGSSLLVIEPESPSETSPREGSGEGTGEQAGLAANGALCFSGDVLFNGSIGRTDLPGSDHAAMQRSLKKVVLALPDQMQVYPGHGPHTSIGMERMVNTYVRQVAGLPLYEPEV